MPTKMKQFLTGIFIFISFCCFSQTIASAEYFFNTDPGVGNGNAITINGNTGQIVQTLSIPVNNLSNGFHSLYIRTQGSNNRWSLYDRQNFYLAIIEDTDISNIEYFFDIDNGLETGNLIVANTNSGQLEQTLSIPTASLANGFHSLYVRTQGSNGRWGLYDRQNFYFATIENTTITAAEYFFDIDNGVGNGTALMVNSNSGQLNQNFNIPITGLADGFHSFYLRTQDNAGHWSLYDRRTIYIKDFDFTPDDITNAEYFIDEDPGIGSGTPVTFNDASETSQILNIDTADIEVGDHLFYIRVQDSNGDWSIYDVAEFTVEISLSLNNTLFKTTTIYPNPFENEIAIKINDNVILSEVKIYNNIGQEVYSSSKNKKTLNLSALKSGLYLLNLKTNTGKASFKIIKK